MTHAMPADHFQVLGVSGDAGDAEIRARYLELVKQYPPDREPEKFREIRAAYEATKDPLSIAGRLIEMPSDEVPPEWSAALESQRRNPPRMSPAFLLSLGNRNADDPSIAVLQHQVRTASDDSNETSPVDETEAL